MEKENTTAGKTAIENELKKYIVVGNTYFKRIAMDFGGQIRLSLVPWSQNEIRSDFAGHRELLKNIEYYDGFDNVPENDPKKYKQVIVHEKDGITSTFYNIYHRVDHQPQPGSWCNIENLLHHLFGEEFNKAIYYLQQLYLHPTKRQPILCLVSSEQETGKTTFLHLLQAIFGQNTFITDSQGLSNRYNLAAGKLIVAVDECFLDDYFNTSCIKKLALKPTTEVTKKGAYFNVFPNYTKMVFCTNADELRGLDLDDYLWTVKTTKIEQRDPHIQERIEAEIPAFLYYLKTLKS